MRRILALLLVLVMAFSFTACKNENVRGEIKNDTSDAEVSGEKEFSLGIANGNVYENKFIGIGCQLDDNWSFYDDEQIKQLNNLVTDAVGDELASQIENADIIYDMYAIHSNGMNNININLENVGLAYNTAVDIEEHFEKAMPSVKEALGNMGYANLNHELVTVKIGKKEFDAVKIISEINGIKMYQLQICIKSGKYLASITFATFNEDTTDEITECFYIVE